ncbi:MAG: FAD-binding oxidoreductase [Desulfobacterales bacterium]|jgi:sarcosine oxidase subunit beta|nr:FAD-binding oxidoreductase [Desulfobacterales bacterium]
MTELPSKAQIVIIGGGIIGAACAYYLTRKGIRDVFVLEQGEIGAQGATSVCLGGLRTQFSTRVNIRFSLISREVYRRFKDEFGIDPGFDPSGYLFLATTPGQWNAFIHTKRLMEELALPIDLLSPRETAHHWPFIRVDDLMGGSYTEDDGFYNPMDILGAFVKKARQGGAVFMEKVRVSGILTSKQQIVKVQTDTGESIQPGMAINAAGPWAGQVAAMAGLKLPVEPLKRHLFFTDIFDEIPNAFPMVIDIDSGWYLKREGRGLILGGPTGEKTFSRNVDFDANEWTAAKSIHRVPALERARMIRGWVGHYEMTPDHHAVIGAFPELRNFICAAGFSGHGFQHAPAAGMAVAELISEGKVHIEDISLLRPTRFRENDLIHEPITAFRNRST